MADCVEMSSGSSSSDSSHNLPSPKRKRSSAKKLQQPARGKYQRVSHKRKGKKESRKRRKVSSSSSSAPSASSLSHDSTESERSDKEVRQKKAKKPKTKKKKANTVASSLHTTEYDAFLENYDRLEMGLSTCINTITSKLVARKLISQDVLGQVITGQGSDREKAQRVLYHVQQQIESNPGKLRTLLEVLKEEPVLDDLTRDLTCDLSPKKEADMLEANTSLSLYKEHLKDVYRRESIARDDKLSIFPCRNFIRLALVHKEGPIHHVDPFTKSTFYGSVDQILATKTPLEMDAVLTPGSQFVLVEGPTGIGKSTLCWELCRKWDDLKSLQDFEIVLQLMLRERYVQDATSLHELFRHDSEEVSRSVADFVLKCRGAGVLFILDGFDEMPSSVVANEDCLVMKLIRGVSLPRATCLVTSRPSALHNKKSCFPQNYRHVEILGFTDEYKRQFAKEAFKTDPEILDRFKKFIFSNPIITSLMHIPVNCAIIAQIYKDSPDVKVPKTMTQLYTLLVLVLIRRHLIQTGRWTRQSRVPSSLESLPEDIKAGLARISEIAYMGLMENILVMFTDKDVGGSFQHLGLLNEAKEMYVSQGAVTHYSFFHLSIQEFLAAWYASHSTEPIFKEFVEGSRSEVSLRFLCGLHSATLAVICELHKLLFYEPCEYVAYFYEAQHQQALGFEPSELEISIDNPFDMFMFGYALVHLPIHWEVLVATSLDMLVSSIADHAPDGRILGTIASLQKHSSIEISFHSLPKYLLKSITGLLLNDDTAPAVALMPHLQRVDLDYTDSTVISQETILSLLKLKYLKTVVITSVCKHNIIILQESEALRSFFSSTSTVENIEMHITSDHPFFILNHSSSLEEIHLEFVLNYDFTFHFMVTSIMCVAYIAKSLSKIRIQYNDVLPPLEACEAAALLHGSLQGNPLLTIESNGFGVLEFHLNFLSHALRKDPDIAHKHFRRSKSLYDISTQKFRTRNLYDILRIPHHSWKLSSGWDSSRRCHSCPDLSEMQALHSMHPQLHEAIGTEKFYFHPVVLHNMHPQLHKAIGTEKFYSHLEVSLEYIHD